MVKLLKPIIFCFSFLLLLILFYSCGSSKFIPEGSYRLKKNNIEIKSKEVSKGELENVIEQDPNKQFLWMKLQMRIYCLSNPNSNNWWNRFIRKQGEAPVIYDPNQTIQTEQKMNLYLNSKGCFNSKVSVTEEKKKKKVKVTYHIEASKRYRIKEISYKAQDTNIQRLLNDWQDLAKTKKKHYYDESILSQDRDKIAGMLLNHGYYGFNKETIIAKVDTNFQNYTLTVEVSVENPLVENKENPDSLRQGKHERYYIKEVYIFPNSIYSLRADTIKYDTTTISIFRKDKKVFSDYLFYSTKKMTLNPKTVLRNVFIDPGELFNLSHSDQTYAGITSLRNYQYVNIEYRPSPKDTSDGRNYVDAYIRMSRNKVNSMSTSLELNNTSPSNSSSQGVVGNWGIEWSLKYQNKNLFGNAEVFTAQYRFAVDFPKKGASNSGSGGFLSHFNTFETGANVGIDIPKFLLPIKSTIMPRNYRPRTNFNLGYNYQYRPDYERSIPNAGFGYKWRGNEHLEHSIFPLELTAVNIVIRDSSFQDSIARVTDPRIKSQYTNHLVTDTRYSIGWSNQDPLRPKDFTALLANAEVAGNIFYLSNSLAGSTKDENGSYTILGLPYAQYVRMDMDLKHYFYFNSSNSLVIRGYMGAGITYGNSLSMPYEKSFFAGGPNNVRGWRLKALGPGGFQNLNSTIFDKTGDISLCLNIEGRFHLFSIFEGAVFVDAGNIWMQRSSTEFPLGNFEFDTFYKQFGVSGGLGLRVNISFFIFRLDFAARFRDPANDPGKYWMINKLQIRDIVINFGIGYPF